MARPHWSKLCRPGSQTKGGRSQFQTMRNKEEDSMNGSSEVICIDVEVSPGSTPYAAGDVVGGLQSAGPVTGYTGLVLNGLAVVDDDNEGAELDLHLFDRAVESIADNETFSPSFATLKSRLFKLQVGASDYETIHGMKTAYLGDINHVLPGPRFWFYLTAGGAPSFAAGKKIWLRFFLLG
jgi:hypothetical protein